MGNEKFELFSSIHVIWCYGKKPRDIYALIFVFFRVGVENLWGLMVELGVEPDAELIALVSYTLTSTCTVNIVYMYFLNTHVHYA